MNKLFFFFLISLLFIATNIRAGSSVSLNGEWKLYYWQQPEYAITTPDGIALMNPKSITAQVPGNVEIDLQRAGLAADPRVGSHIFDFRKWESYQWCYDRQFTVPLLSDGQKLQLFFGGIDCLAEIWLNGHHIGSVDNMLIEHVFDVTKIVKQGRDNHLQVIIRSAVLDGQNHFLGQICIGQFPSEESVYIRKAPHMFGWDNQPRLVSAGLWRNVELRIIDPVSIRDVNYITTAVDTALHTAYFYADVQLSLPFSALDSTHCRLTFSKDSKEVFRQEIPVVTTAFRFNTNIKNIDFWWPRGYGKPSLYDACVEIIDSKGKVIASDKKKYGFRTIKLDRTDINLPNKPSRFCFIVNGEKIFVHGSNWVPLDALHSRDATIVAKTVNMAADLNCNMLRCWGGNVYEDHRFFDLCDSLGIMVWQDFAMACTYYPNQPDFAKKIMEEVKSVAIKLRNHPSLVLWAGNNEDDGGHIWSLHPFDYHPSWDRISRNVIPDVLRDFDVTRPYLPSSPYYSDSVYAHGSKDEFLPENHLWGTRGYYKDSMYTEAKQNFVSEIGHRGVCSLESLRKMFSKDKVYPFDKYGQWNDEWNAKMVRRFGVSDYQKEYKYYYLDLITKEMKLLFGEVPQNLDDFIFASQVDQAEAFKYWIEMWRGKKFNPTTGILWWNLREGWPGCYEGVVDYYFSKKLAYYFIRNVQKDVCVFINDDVNGAFPIIVDNDSKHVSSGHIEITDVASGQKVYFGNYNVEANGQKVLAHLTGVKGQGMFKISYTVDGYKQQNHYLYGKAPFRLADYKKWFKSCMIIPEKSK